MEAQEKYIIDAQLEADIEAMEEADRECARVRGPIALDKLSRFASVLRDVFGDYVHAVPEGEWIVFWRSKEKGDK